VFAISGLINLKTFNFAESGDDFALICCVASLAVSVIFPGAMLVYVMVNQVTLASKSNKFTSMHGGLRPYSKWSLAYYFIFFMRRFFFALAVAFLVED